MNLLRKQPVLDQKSKTFKLVFEPNNSQTLEYGTLLNSLFGLQYTNDKFFNPVFTFGIESRNDKSNFYVIIPEDYIGIFKRKYAVVDPYIEFEEMEDPIEDLIETNEKVYIEGYNMKLMYDDIDKKLKTDTAEKNFLSNLLNSMNNAGTGDVSIMEISLQSVGGVQKTKEGSDDLANKILMTAGNLTMRGLGAILDATIMNGEIKKIREADTLGGEKVDKEGKSKKEDKSYIFSPRFNVEIKVISKSDDYKSVIDNIKGMAAVFGDLSESNSLVPIKMKYEDIPKRIMKHTNMLTSSEIIQFLHLPDKNISCENMNTSNCRKIYDRNVPTNGLVFGESNSKPVAFPINVLSPNTYEKMYKDVQRMVDNMCKPKLILGQQGTGKSEWIINYVIALAKCGIGVIVVDPKNDTQQRLLESLPEDLMKKVIYINLGDTKYPPGMNIFRKRHQNDPTENSLIVTSFISLMKKEFAKNWGFRIQRQLQMTAEAILLNDDSTLNEFELMLTERVYREHMIERMKYLLEQDDTESKGHIKKLLKYWEQFNTVEDKFISKDIEPVMNQIGPFLSNRIIRSIVSQRTSFDFRKAADEGKIVIINIPEGVIGDNSKLLASMVNKTIWLDIQSRADVDISKRYPVGWIIDEAHELVDDEFVGVLTKARAYRLGLTLATQGLTNFTMRGMENIKELILTNCKNKIAFRVGWQDAQQMAEEFEPLGRGDLLNCPDYHFYSKILLEDGQVSNPFFCGALPMAKKLRDYDDFVKKHRSGKMTVDQIEDELEERLESLNLMNALLQG